VTPLILDARPAPVRSWIARPPAASPSLGPAQLDPIPELTPGERAVLDFIHGRCETAGQPGDVILTRENIAEEAQELGPNVEAIAEDLQLRGFIWGEPVTRNRKFHARLRLTGKAEAA
jgi:hypothetical protein